MFWKTSLHQPSDPDLDRQTTSASGPQQTGQILFRFQPLTRPHSGPVQTSSRSHGIRRTSQGERSHLTNSRRFVMCRRRTKYTELTPTKANTSFILYIVMIIFLNSLQDETNCIHENTMLTTHFCLEINDYFSFLSFAHMYLYCDLTTLSSYMLTAALVLLPWSHDEGLGFWPVWTCVEPDDQTEINVVCGGDVMSGKLCFECVCSAVAVGLPAQIFAFSCCSVKQKHPGTHSCTVCIIPYVCV